MNKKSLMAPKRRSKRPRLSRDEAQLKRGEFPLTTDIQFTPVMCGKKDGVTHYRLKLKGDNDSIVELKDLKEDFFGTGIRIEMVEQVIDCICSVVPRYIARTGNAVRIGGLVTLKPYATGTIDKANGEADPQSNYVEIRATEVPSLLYSLKNARLVNASGHLRGIKKVAGSARPTDGIIDAANDIYISGYDSSELFVHKNASGDSDEGVWLETLDGRRIARCSLSSAGKCDLIARIPPNTPVEPGEYQILVVTRGTENAPVDTPLCSYRRKVNLVAAS